MTTPSDTRVAVIADDSDTDRILLAALLRKAGFRVDAVSDGAAAVVAARTHDPDVIMLDVQMPGLSGEEACRQIKADPALREIPVIFISAGTHTDDKLKAFKAGGVDYITKPYHAAEVIARVHAHAELFRSRREIVALNRQLQAANAELERLSLTDALTELANRACFDRSLAKEWRRAQRDKTPLGLVMIDVDHFKAYNDTYGHPAGDACLKAVARAVQDAAHRPYDLAARYGGEEMAVLLPATPAEGCRIVAERLRATVEGLGLPHAGSKTTSVVTISVGVACHTPEHADGAQGLVAAADQALYRAKHGGRNRVETGCVSSC